MKVAFYILCENLFLSQELIYFFWSHNGFYKSIRT